MMFYIFTRKEKEKERWKKNNKVVVK